MFAAAAGWIFPLAHADEPAVLQQQLNLQRFQSLCRSTNPGPPIRVLIYGQSITGQPWSMRMMDEVRNTYPQRDWVIENRCIGGSPSQYLVHLAEADLYPFNPDLLVFHAYGDLDAYRRLVASVRARTTADILLINDHYVGWDSLATPGIGDWDGRILPELALEYGACMADIRTPWKQYLLDNHLPIAALLFDTVHPNLAGQALMRSLATRYVSGPSLIPSPDPFACGRVRRVTLQEAAGAPGERRLTFNGNRVVAHVRTTDGTVRILLDGRPPGAWPSGAVHGRASTWPGGKWPCLLQIRTDAPMVAEKWSLQIDSITRTNAFQFSVVGESTGADGSGSTDETFRSRSGRVVIQPQDWYWDALYSELSVGMVFSWSSIPTGVDSVSGRTGSGSPEWVDLVSNLETGPHELVFSQTSESEVIGEVIIYDPSGPDIGTPGVLYCLPGIGGVLVSGWGNVEESDDLRDWSASPLQGDGQRWQKWMPYSEGPMHYVRMRP